MYIWECDVCGEGDIADFVDKCPFCNELRDDNTSMYLSDDPVYDAIMSIDEDTVRAYTDDLMLNIGIAVYEREGGYLPVGYNYIWPNEGDTVHELPVEGTFREAAKSAINYLVDCLNRMKEGYEIT